jgi:hypothetical protein
MSLIFIKKYLRAIYLKKKTCVTAETEIHTQVNKINTSLNTTIFIRQAV